MMNTTTMDIPDELYPLVIELMGRLGIVVHPQPPFDPVKDAELIASLIAAEKQAREHPELSMSLEDYERGKNPTTYNLQRAMASHEAYLRAELKTEPFETVMARVRGRLK